MPKNRLIEILCYQCYISTGMELDYQDVYENFVEMIEQITGELREVKE